MPKSTAVHSCELAPRQLPVIGICAVLWLALPGCSSSGGGGAPGSGGTSAGTTGSGGVIGTGGAATGGATGAGGATGGTSVGTGGSAGGGSGSGGRTGGAGGASTGGTAGAIQDAGAPDGRATGGAGTGGRGSGGAGGTDARPSDPPGGDAIADTRDVPADRVVAETDPDVPAALPGSLVNGIQWADTSGKPIQAHGGGMLRVGDYYYWFGENRNPNGTFYAVSCYRSADLVHWEFRNNVLTSSSGAGLNPANIERPKVVYNATTRKYVMWMHWENGSDYGEARAATASCDTVDGNYTYHGSARPLVNSGVTDHGKPGYMSRDCTLFVDSDGKGYFLSASNENADLNLYLLSADYLSIDSLAAVLFKGGVREAPALWKRGNVYFLITSAATGWNPNQAKYATSTSLTSGWSNMTNVGDSTTFYSQSTYVLPIEGTAGTAFLYLGDRWAGAWGGPVNDSTYVWLPITFPSNTSMSLTWNNTITIDAAAGTLTAATNRFKLVNRASGKALSIEGGGTSEGAKAVQMPYTGGDDQKWSLNYDNAGYFRLTNLKSSLVLEVSSQSTSDGAALVQYTDNGGANQKWRIVDKGGGLYQLLNKNSNKLAEVASGATADGAAVVQRASSGGDNQLWEMSPGN